jgi:hypothetical protein
MGVPAILVDDIDDAENLPGAIEFASNDAGLFYVCPCGCTQVGYLPFKPKPSPSWAWDGNRAAPTLFPSIHHQITRTGGARETHWHGWLRNGVFTSC